LNALLERSGYLRFIQDGTTEGQERVENVQELIAKAHDYDELDPDMALGRFLEEVSLVQDVDNLQSNANAVTLITLHAAKGLEFPTVFITGLEEGLFPHARSVDSPTQLEEERRLFYVGITRAMDELHLVHAFRRSFGGSSNENGRSRFLEDIPRDLLRES